MTDRSAPVAPDSLRRPEDLEIILGPEDEALLGLAPEEIRPALRDLMFVTAAAAALGKPVQFPAALSEAINKLVDGFTGAELEKLPADERDQILSLRNRALGQNGTLTATSETSGNT